MNGAGLTYTEQKGYDRSCNPEVYKEEVLEHMRNRLSDYQEQYPGELFNLEATPAGVYNTVLQA